MKREKHITINLTAEQFQEIENRARQDRRKIADFVALLVVDQLEGAKNKND